jgi:hypothetical protein
VSFEHCIEILPIFAIGGMRNVLKCAFVLGTNYGDKHSDEACIEISIFFFHRAQIQAQQTITKHISMAIDQNAASVGFSCKYN